MTDERTQRQRKRIVIALSLLAILIFGWLIGVAVQRERVLQSLLTSNDDYRQVTTSMLSVQHRQAAMAAQLRELIEGRVSISTVDWHYPKPVQPIADTPQFNEVLTAHWPKLIYLWNSVAATQDFMFTLLSNEEAIDMTSLSGHGSLIEYIREELNAAFYWRYQTQLIDQLLLLDDALSEESRALEASLVERERHLGLKLRFLGVLLLGVAVAIAVTLLRGQVLSKERQLEEALATLHKKNKQQSEMFGIISHELRTPAAAITMLAESGDYSRETFADISTSALHLLHVIDDLRIAVNPDVTIPLEIQVFSLQRLMSEAITQVYPLFQDGSMSLIYAPAINNSDQWFKGDAYRLRTVVTNLIRNAHAHSGGNNIWVDAHVGDSDAGRCFVRLVVEDDGVGIAEEDRRRVFLPFERGATSARGTGAGLHIVNSWTSLMGGSVDYFPSKHGGAGFSVELWLVPSDPPIEKKPRLGRQSAMLSVLLVEDDAMLRKLTSEVLTNELGFEVSTAANGLQAMELVKDWHPDLIVTDFLMPEMDGMTMTQAMRDQGLRVPIIGLTASTIGNETELMLEMGANKVLSKPINLEYFKLVLDELRAEGKLKH